MIVLKYLMTATALVAGVTAKAAEARDIQFFVLVKSSNHAQGADGALERLNYHFFSEVFVNHESALVGATLRGGNYADVLFEFEDRGRNHYFEGGHFDTLAMVDARHPNGEYAFEISTLNDGDLKARLRLAGPEGRTDIPEPIQIFLQQGGAEISPLVVDPAEDLRVQWSEYSNGSDDPRGIVDDMIFVVVADCFGERIFHTGLPFGDRPYLRHDAPYVTVKAGLLQPGEPYSMFVEFPHVVDSVLVGDTPGFASFATATYLDLQTAGAAQRDCPASQPPMDTGQTDRMEVGLNAVEDPTGHRQFARHYTMLYYSELEPADRFYGELLGLERSYEDDWVRLYRTTEKSYIGVVREGPGAFHRVRGENAVMVSLVTEDVDALYRRLAEEPDVRIESPLQDKASAPIRAFIVRDPGGYTVEVFRWLSQPD